MEWMIALAVLVLLLIFVIAIYNRLIRYRNEMRNAFSQVDVQLQRRYDLIPNLVEIAKRYLSHEQDTLERVIQARTRAVDQLKQTSKKPDDNQRMQGLADADNALTGALGRLFAVSESYPELKADANLQRLSEELSSTENRVAFARQAYNDAVMVYDNQRQVFPNNMIAGVFGFTPGQLLEIESAEQRKAPRVDMS